jgi:hypothetical protein
MEAEILGLPLSKLPPFPAQCRCRNYRHYASGRLVSTPRIELIQFDRNRLEVFAAGSNFLPNSPGFEPHALREGASFTVPERSTPGASAETPVSADSIRNFERTVVVVGKLNGSIISNSETTPCDVRRKTMESQRLSR